MIGVRGSLRFVILNAVKYSKAIRFIGYHIMQPFMMALWHVAKASSSKCNDRLPESQQNQNVLSISQKGRSEDKFCPF